jgi:hypothetical protein
MFNPIAELAQDIDLQVLGRDSHRVADILEKVRNSGETFVLRSEDRSERPATQAEIESAARYLEQRFIESMQLAPLADFEAASFQSNQAPSWRAIARRYYEGAVPFDPEQFAKKLYVEFDGQQPEPLEVEDDYQFQGAPANYVEWFPLGRLPRHRATSMGHEPSVYPVPMTTTIREFNRAPIRAREGRVWPMHLYVRGENIVSRRAVRREVWEAGGNPRHFDDPSGDPTALYLVEIYYDRGEDGWSNYELAGHATLTGPQLAQYLELMLRRTRPRASLADQIMDTFGTEVPR